MHYKRTYASTVFIYSTEACMKLVLCSSTRPRCTLHALYNDTRNKEKCKEREKALKSTEIMISLSSQSIINHSRKLSTLPDCLCLYYAVWR